MNGIYSVDSLGLHRRAEPHHRNTHEAWQEVGDDPVAFIEEFNHQLTDILELDARLLIERLQPHCPFPIVEVSRKLGNKITGESVRFVYGADGEFATFYSVEPGDFIPFEHEHTNEAEDFHLLSGEFTLFLNQQPVHAKAGETVHVPANTWHYGQNDGDQLARFFVNFVKDTNAYSGKAAFQAYWLLCDIGYVDDQGKPEVGKMLRLTAENASITHVKGVPKELQDVAKFFVDRASRDVLDAPPSAS